MKKLLLALIVGVSFTGMMGKPQKTNLKKLYTKNIQTWLKGERLKAELKRQNKQIEQGQPKITQRKTEAKTKKELQLIQRDEQKLLEIKQWNEQVLLQFKQKDQKTKNMFYSIITKNYNLKNQKLDLTSFFTASNLKNQ